MQPSKLRLICAKLLGWGLRFSWSKNILGHFLAYVRLTRKAQHDPNFFQAHVCLTRG